MTENGSNLVLVTGASGFIGSHLCRVLLNSGQRVRAAVRSGSDLKYIQSLLDSEPGGIEIMEFDISDQSSLNLLCSDVNLVFHVAGVAHAGINDNDLLTLVNVEATTNLLKASQESGVSRLIYISSILAQAHDSISGSHSNDDAYGLSKRRAEEVLLKGAHDNFKVNILRPVNVYGPGMKGNIAGMIRRIETGSLPPLPKLGNSLSLVGVKDLCEAALLVATNSSAGSRVYPVTDGANYTPNIIEEAIYRALGRKKPGWRTPRVVFYAASLGAQIANNLGIWKNDYGLRTYRNLTGQGTLQAASCEKITTELGYQPSQTFVDALPDIIKHMEQESAS